MGQIVERTQNGGAHGVAAAAEGGFSGSKLVAVSHTKKIISGDGNYTKTH